MLKKNEQKHIISLQQEIILLLCLLISGFALYNYTIISFAIIFIYCLYRCAIRAQNKAIFIEEVIHELNKEFEIDFLANNIKV